MSEAEARPTNFIRQIIEKIWPVVSTPQYTPVSRRSRRLSAYWPCEIYLPELRDRPGYKGQCNLRFDDTNPVKEDIDMSIRSKTT